MNAQSIGECAGVVWRLLYGDKRRWEYKEIKAATGLSNRDLNAAIGWLAREGKIQFINLPDREEALYIDLNLYIG